MDLQNISNAELLNRMEKLVRSERKITHLILMHILEIESRRIYADLGFDGMYTYLTRGLGYSEAAAYRRLQAARLLKQVPEVAEKIESGALRLSQLTQVQKCLKASAEKGAMVSPVATLKVLENLENKNSFETDQVLAKAFDLTVKTYDVLKPQKDESVRLEITLTAEQFRDLQVARDLLSHVCIDGTWSEVIAVLAKKFIGKSAGGHGHRKIESEIEATSTQRVIAAKVGRRKAIPVKIKRDLLKKAQSCCEYQDPQSGRHCKSKYQLQIDHIKPIALGGNNEPENPRVLCRTHNLLMAMRQGIGWGRLDRIT